MEKGILYGIGVGPGDPELLTLKAVRLIRESDVIMTPAEDVRQSIAYEIVRQAVPEIEEKECVGVKIPMTRDQEERSRFHDLAADRVTELLDQGKQVAFLNLGDVTVYASYQYIHRRVLTRGYCAELVNGITSFTAAAARLNISVAEDAQQIHVLSQPEQIQEGLKLSGTKIIMKMGKNMAQVKQWIRESGLNAMMVERCGMPDERIMNSVDEIDEHAGYYSLLIVKDREDEGKTISGGAKE